MVEELESWHEQTMGWNPFWSWILTFMYSYEPKTQRIYEFLLGISEGQYYSGDAFFEVIRIL